MPRRKERACERVTSDAVMRGIGANLLAVLRKPVFGATRSRSYATAHCGARCRSVRSAASVDRVKHAGTGFRGYTEVEAGKHLIRSKSLLWLC